MKENLISLDRWSLIPGPIENPPLDSLALHDIVRYAPEQIAATFLNYPGMRLVHDPTPSWWEWSASWKNGSQHIEIAMSLFDDEEEWGGSPLRGQCEVASIIALWSFVCSRLPGIWMHNDACEIHTPETFVNLFAGRPTETD